MLQLVITLALAATMAQCEEEVMKNLTTVTWAHAVNDKAYLEKALASDVSMLEADIVLGHITGKDGPPIPVMAHPPATTSDLSLSEFLSTVKQHNNLNSKQKGVKLDFKSIEAFEKAQPIIAPYSKPEVRAGIASNSQPVLLDLLRETAYLNSSMTVWSSEGDFVEVDRLRALLLTVGLERSYLDVPKDLADRLHLPPAANVKN
ncbi:unnamed protein product [Diatraea saccharalis]|uniref:Menorin-like domain-containing protein n=1 Tax=Diatraea saccharalis TaxID=40085 RepID=A0A9P0C624_9NEOP|nr:unnamed protein product [Diatraea saccharalis]